MKQSSGDCNWNTQLASYFLFLLYGATNCDLRNHFLFLPFLVIINFSYMTKIINPLTLIIKTIFADKIIKRKKNKKNIPSFLILYSVSSPNLRPYNVNFNLIKHGKNLLHLPLVPMVGQEMLNQDEDMV